MKDSSFFFFKNILFLFIFSISFYPVLGVASVIDEILEGDAKLSQGEIQEAEKHYTTALGMDPENWRIMRSLAEVKFQLKKYKETQVLVDRILAKEVIKRNTVMVTLEGDPEPFEAELIDERVVLPDDRINNMKKVMDSEVSNHNRYYRLFKLKTGQILLTPHKSTKIQYKGVPSRIYAYVQELHAKVENILISKTRTKGPVEMMSLKGGCFKMGSNNHHKSER